MGKYELTKMGKYELTKMGKYELTKRGKGEMVKRRKEGKVEPQKSEVGSQSLDAGYWILNHEMGKAKEGRVVDSKGGVRRAECRSRLIRYSGERAPVE